VHRPIRILPFGPDMNVYSRPPVWKPRLELGIPDGAPLLLYAGRLAKEKNLVFLLAAFAEIRKNAKDAVMVWAGDGAMRGWLEEEGRRLGLEEAQRFTGFLDRARLTDLYKATDLLLFASKSETQGLVLVEAMAAGVPVIAVRAMGVRDVVENEVSGLLVPESVTEFARDATRVLADPALRACLSDEAKRAAEPMSIQRCAEHLVEIYEEARADLRHPARRLVSLGTRPKRCAEQGRARRGLPLRSEEQTADASSPSATCS